MQLTGLITVLSLAPSLLVMVTAFTRIVIVLSLLRSAVGAQGTPPNSVLIGLALFLTFFVMQPVLEQSWTTGLLPLGAGQVGELEGLRLAAEPFRKFMAAIVRGTICNCFRTSRTCPRRPAPEQAEWRTLVPAFMIGELRRAFEMGFLLYLPFLVIDLVVGQRADVARHDDAAAERGQPAVQADLLRAGRRLAARLGQPGAGFVPI